MATPDRRNREKAKDIDLDFDSDFDLDPAALVIMRITVARLTIVVPRQYYTLMPKKIRELIRDLKGAGFVDRGGKGSHRNFTHIRGAKVTISGNASHDAKPYQERAVEQAIRRVIQ